MSQARFVTIGISHYCEKARWFMDRAGFPYLEEPHAPILHKLATTPAGGSSTPLLVQGDVVLTDSTDILKYVEEKTGVGLYPRDPVLRAEAEKEEDYFDEKFAPHTRRLGYHLLLPHRKFLVAYLQKGLPSWEATTLPWIFPMGEILMRRMMKITDEGSQRSKVRVDEVFEQVAHRLADGRRYLTGDTFNVVDLTFASLAAPMVMPAEYGWPWPTLDELPPNVAEVVRHYRNTQAGEFVLRLYREERQKH